MNLLRDLDTATWVATSVAIVVCALVSIIDMRRWRQKKPIRGRRKRLFLWGSAAVCLWVGIDTISDASDAAHLLIQAPVQPVIVYRGHVVACVAPCNPSGPLFKFDGDAAKVLRSFPPETVFTIGYLNEKTEVRPDVFAYQVVNISEAHGRSLYHLDTRHHPVRVGTLFADAALLLLTGLLVGRLAGASPDTEDDYENYRDSRDSEVGPVLTSLDLSGEHTEEAALADHRPPRSRSIPDTESTLASLGLDESQRDRD